MKQIITIKFNIMKNLQIKISKRFKTITYSFKGFSSSAELISENNINGTYEDYVLFLKSKIVKVEEKVIAVKEYGSLFYIKSFVFLDEKQNVIFSIQKSKESIELINPNQKSERTTISYDGLSK